MKRGASSDSAGRSVVSSAKRQKQSSKPQLSDFRRRVLAALKKYVPKGHFTTYGRLAKAVGTGSARSIGGALRHNPFAPVVPCHRVLASDFSLGGFSGVKAIKGQRPPEIARKIALLEKEGLHMDGDDRLASWCRDKLVAFDDKVPVELSAKDLTDEALKG